jgi:hypothetical protein
LDYRAASTTAAIETLTLERDIAQGCSRDLREALEEIRHHSDTWSDEPTRAIRLINNVVDKALNKHL